MLIFGKASFSFDVGKRQKKTKHERPAGRDHSSAAFFFGSVCGTQNTLVYELVILKASKISRK